MIIFANDIEDMEQKQITATYAEAVKAIKEAILESRYRAARLVNKEVLALYYSIGGYISVQSRAARWGSNAIGTISELLQQELPGLRGFSETSIKRMRIFYEAWCNMFENRPLSADDLQNSIIPVGDKGHIEIRPLATDELPPETLDAFLAVGFTNHYEILAQKKDVEQRLFYIVKDLRSKALRAFKDEYLLDFVNIEDPDEMDERVIEQQIVHNIKNFIMALGSDFSFMGNQYRLVVSEKEYFIDLLFFNRRLQALIAIELKRGEFKPEYAGKLNFYLSALDEYVKLPHENPSIGIILCKDRDSKTVEFAFRDINKPMGVATYRTSSELPKEYQGILPEPEELRKLL